MLGCGVPLPRPPSGPSPGSVLWETERKPRSASLGGQGWAAQAHGEQHPPDSVVGRAIGVVLPLPHGHAAHAGPGGAVVRVTHATVGALP